MTSTSSTQRTRLLFAGIILTLLLAAVFTLGSLDTPFEPRNWRDVLTLYAVSSFITAALIVFALIVSRTLLRLWAERSREEFGARFKTKMVVGALAISLLPVIFMFFMSYSLLNRTLARWFPRPIEIASEQSSALLNDLSKDERNRLGHLAAEWAAWDSQDPASPSNTLASRCTAAEAFWQLDSQGKLFSFFDCRDETPAKLGGSLPISPTLSPSRLQLLPSGAEVWQSGAALLLAAPARASNGRMYYAARTIPPDFLVRINEITRQTLAYDQEKQHLRALKRQLLLILSFFTVLLLSPVLWLALYLAKQVTVPIQALAEGTREISGGNFDYQVPEQTHDELGTLVHSFNSMTTQLRDSRSQIDQFTHNLQEAVRELERRRQLIETVLENIPTGAISLDPEGNIVRINPAVTKIVGPGAKDARNLEELVGPEDARAIRYLMRRALRTGVVSRELEIIAGGRILHAAVTVSSLGPRRANSGYVVVLDDLTELLRAQKAAAWQEVARRIAHEIKNPLTPIQLSAQRLLRYLEKRESTADSPSNGSSPRDPELARLVEEAGRLIEREVGTLSALVNEFSQFVRFPSAKLDSADVNAIVREAIEVFSNRLDGITLNTSFAAQPPAIRADAPLLRSVVVNLIDNAAEALETSPVRNISVSTRTNPDSDFVEIVVADTGHGISPQDKDKLFLPHFSTKDRGTGLGLAIAARIVAEHGGGLRVEDNSPVGSRFILELPSAEVLASTPSDRPV
ncbi:MAG TPA: ATP-binding protein [Candidatus Acidoferrum sp.]|nr:ATP-binding protein [Candidatus Acidoferrum sp.]